MATQRKRRDHISIHALLAESDGNPREGGTATWISIHALLAESDFSPDSLTIPCFTFLSTLSLRRATIAFAVQKASIPYFYPRSPCGERLNVFHAVDTASVFLSTLSLRRATNRVRAILPNGDFYPRSPCGERLVPPAVGDGVFVFLSTLSLRRATLTHCAVG